MDGKRGDRKKKVNQKRVKWKRARGGLFTAWEVGRGAGTKERGRGRETREERGRREEARLKRPGAE